MQDVDSDAILAFASQDEAVKWIITAYLDQRKEIIRLNEEVADLRQLDGFRMEQITQDRQRLAKLEKGELQPKQKDHREILLSLVASRNGKMTAKDARQLMHLSKQAFSNLLAALKDEIEVRPMKTDKRRKLLIAR